MSERDETITKQGGPAIAEAPVASTALATVPVEERGLRGLQLAEEMFTPAQREQVAAMLTVPTDSPALMPYLALCVAEGFSPWANHVWLIPKKIKVRAQDGEEVEETKHLPAVGRDGLLHKARQSPLFEDLDFGVVCEHDTFEAWRDPEAREWKVLHRQASKPTEFAEGEAPDRWRGRVIGAWALLYLKGKRPTYYFANLREHGRLKQTWAYNPEAHKRKPLWRGPKGVTFDEFSQIDGKVERNAPVQEWEGAWDYLSTMILKSAQSYVCRIGLGVTGFVPVDELRNVEEWQAGDVGPSSAALGSVTIESADVSKIVPDAPEELRMQLQRAIDAANDQEPFSWAPAKCEMVLTGRSEDELRAILEGIERENELRAQRADRASAAAAAAAPAEEEVDGEVVEGELTAEQRDRVEAARHRLADLQAARDELQAGSEQDAALAAEMDQVEAEIRSITGGSPGQGDLGI